jgi:hypothetical protein
VTLTGVTGTVEAMFHAPTVGWLLLRTEDKLVLCGSGGSGGGGGDGGGGELSLVPRRLTPSSPLRASPPGTTCRRGARWPS